MKLSADINFLLEGTAPVVFGCRADHELSVGKHSRLSPRVSCLKLLLKKEPTFFLLNASLSSHNNFFGVSFQLMHDRPDPKCRKFVWYILWFALGNNKTHNRANYWGHRVLRLCGVKVNSAHLAPKKGVSVNLVFLRNITWQVHKQKYAKHACWRKSLPAKLPLYCRAVEEAV